MNTSLWHEIGVQKCLNLIYGLKSVILTNLKVSGKTISWHENVISSSKRGPMLPSLTYNHYILSLTDFPFISNFQKIFHPVHSYSSPPFLNSLRFSNPPTIPDPVQQRPEYRPSQPLLNYVLIILSTIEFLANLSQCSDKQG